MPRGVPFKYLVLSGDLPGEGFWCTALRYEELVQRVRELWGEDFNPVFKYKLAASPEGAKEELRYHSADAAFRHECPTTTAVKSAASETSEENSFLSRKPQEEACDVKVREAGMTGMCYVILDDACDFDLWVNGGSLLEMAEHTHTESSPAHHADYHAIDNPRPHPLTTKIYAFRKTTVEAPGALAHDVDKCRESYHPYYHTVTTKDGVFRFRSSPAVKNSEESVVRVPVHSLIAPLTLLRLNVTAVLRHSNASEVILWGANAPLSGGCGWWGQLVLKAKSAWGVHSPLLRYLDLTMGMQQMNITDVINFRMWAEGVGLDRPELLVLEQAPPSDLCYDAFLKKEMLRHYQCHPPPPADGVSLDVLVKKLEQLELEELEARVGRPQHTSVAGEKPGVVEEFQNHVHGIPLHHLGLAPPRNSRNPIRRTEAEEARYQGAERLPALSAEREDDTVPYFTPRGVEAVMARLTTGQGRATLAQMELLREEMKHQGKKTDALEELIAVETRLRVKEAEDVRRREGSPPPSLEEMVGLLEELRREGKKTVALEELIRVEKVLRQEEVRSGEHGTNLYEGLIPELSISSREASGPALSEPSTTSRRFEIPELAQKPPPCSHPGTGVDAERPAACSASQHDRKARPPQASECIGSVQPTAQCYASHGPINDPYGHPQYVQHVSPHRVDWSIPALESGTKAAALGTSNTAACGVPAGAQKSARGADASMAGCCGPPVCTIRRPYGEHQFDSLIKSIEDGDFGPRFTTPAKLMTTEQQQLAAMKHQLQVTEQFRREREIRQLCKRNKSKECVDDEEV